MDAREVVATCGNLYRGMIIIGGILSNGSLSWEFYCAADE